MAANKSARLEELAKFATDFVTAQKGMWDHAAWTNFVSGLKTKGFDISGEMQANLGELLEAMKRFYAAAASTGSMKSSMSTVMNDSVAFIKRQKGVWGHSEWEGFLQTMERNTLNLTEGATAYLGGVLESIKVFYSISPVSPVQKSAPPPPPESLPATTSAPPPPPKPSPAATSAPPPSPKPSPAATSAPPPSPKPSPAATSVPPPPPKPSPAATSAPPPAPKPSPAATSVPPPAPKPSAAARPAPVVKKEAETKPAGAKVEGKPSIQRSDRKDDLTAIAGIGPALARKLNAAGIVGYAQLAALSDKDIAHLEKNVIKFTGRIKRDGWVGQAKKLSQK